jgi:MSHA biogenesis protein MshQ
LQTLTQRRSTPNNSNAVANAHLRIGGWWANNSYRFRGRLDEVKIYTGTMDQATVDADIAYVSGSCPDCPPPPAATIIAEYTFDDDWNISNSLTDTVGASHGVVSGAITRIATPAEDSKPDSCFGGEFSGGAIDINGLPVSVSVGDKTSISFWMNWDGTNSVMPLGFNRHDLWFFGGNFGFNSAGGDLYGISSAGLANGWHHVAVVFTNNNLTANKMYIDGILQSLSQLRASPNNSSAIVDQHLRIGGWWANNGYRFRGKLDELRVYDGELREAQVLSDMNSGCFKPVAQWLMDEPAWDNASNDVLDNTGNNNNGRAFNGATTAGGGSCYYGKFDGANDYVQIPHSDELNGSDALTYMAWVRADTWTGVDQIIAKSVHGGGSGRAQMGLFSEGGVLKGRAETNNGRREVNTILPLVAGDWNHVALVFNGTSLTIFTDGNQVAQTTFDPTTLVQTTDPLNISKRVGTNQYYFDGLMDDVRVYTQAVSEAALNEIIANTSLCPIVSVDHFDIDHANSAVFCAPTLVTVTAEDASNITEDTYTGTITIDTGEGVGNWSLDSGYGSLNNGTDNDGIASYTFDSADNGVVVFALDYSDSNQPTASINITVIDGSISDDDLEGNLNLATMAFALSGEALVNSPSMVITPVAPQVAGVDFPVYITAIGENPDNSSCGIITSYQGSHSLTFSVDYNNPGSGTIVPTVDDNNFSSSQVINFVAGVATPAPSFNYKDVGSIVLNVSDGSLSGSSDSFVVQPAQYVITVNGGSAAATDAGVFIAAGNNFTVQVQVQSAGGEPALNFGNESGPESIGLLHSLFSPTLISGGSPGALSVTPFIKVGDATYTSNVQWDEVGIIDLTASVADGDYMGIGAGNTISTTQTQVGRFTPDHFVVEDHLLMPAINNFSYLDQLFTVEFTVRAVNLAGSTTTNYDGGFNTLVVDDSNNYGAVNNTAGVVTMLTNRIVTGSATPSWSGGELVDFSMSLSIARASAVDGPFPDTAVGLMLVDGDGVTLEVSALNLDAELPLGDNDRQQLGGSTGLRYGRVMIPPVYGPEIPAGIVPPMLFPFEVQYWDGAAFVVSADDDGTVYGATTIMSSVEGYSNYRDNLNGGETSVIFPVSSVPVVEGRMNSEFPIIVRRPGAGNSGSVDIQIPVDPWLQYFWGVPGVAINPIGNVSFGIYRGHDRIIYRQEVLQ